MVVNCTVSLHVRVSACSLQTSNYIVALLERKSVVENKLFSTGIRYSLETLVWKCESRHITMLVKLGTIAHMKPIQMATMEVE